MDLRLIDQSEVQASSWRDPERTCDLMSGAGALLFAGGGVRLKHALDDKSAPDFGWMALTAGAYMLAGVLVALFPGMAVLTMTLMLGSFLVVGGGLKIGCALALRGVARWGVLLADGVVTLALGVLLWAGFPENALWALGVVVGVDMIVGGAAMVALSGGLRRLQTA